MIPSQRERKMSGLPFARGKSNNFTSKNIGVPDPKHDFSSVSIVHSPIAKQNLRN
jgi:hypothetical protein